MQRFDPVNLYMSHEYRRPLSLEVGEMPSLIVVQASSLCNYSCRMCKREVVVEKRDHTGLGNGFLSVELAEKIAKDCHNGEGVIGMQFALYGEPLLNPDIVSIVRKIRQHGVRLQIVTNGSLLTERMALDLMEAGLSKIKVSFQGATEEAYSFWRNSGRYREIVENIHRLVELRDKNKSDLYIQVGTSSCDDKLEDLARFNEYWNEVADHAYWNLTVLSHVADDPEIGKRNIVRQAPFRTEKCVEPFKRMAVMWNGLVTQCVSVEENFMGDLNSQSIREIWHGSRFNSCRETILSQGNVLKNCDICCVQPAETKDYEAIY